MFYLEEGGCSFFQHYSKKKSQWKLEAVLLINLPSWERREKLKKQCKNTEIRCINTKGFGWCFCVDQQPCSNNEVVHWISFQVIGTGRSAQVNNWFYKSFYWRKILHFLVSLPRYFHSINWFHIQAYWILDAIEQSSEQEEILVLSKTGQFFFFLWHKMCQQEKDELHLREDLTDFIFLSCALWWLGHHFFIYIRVQARDVIPPRESSWGGGHWPAHTTEMRKVGNNLRKCGKYCEKEQLIMLRACDAAEAECV